LLWPSLMWRSQVKDQKEIKSGQEDHRCTRQRASVYLMDYYLA
jgi:hypothetical protein